MSEGTVFVVPYRSRAGDERQALGVVARRQPRGSIVAVYVFTSVPPGLDTAGGALPPPTDAEFRGRLSDHYLRTGAWPILWVQPSFPRGDWPFDAVGHRDALTGRCKVVHLDDRNPLKVIGLVDQDCGNVAGLPGDTIHGADGLVVNVLPDLSADASS